MYAVIRTGGKQYRVAPEDVIEIEKIPGDVGETVQFGDVLMVGGEGSPEVGTPMVSGASVAAEVLGQDRARKIIVFKKKRRKNYRRKKGHRQELTTVRIMEILTGGKKASKAKAAPKKAEAKSDEAADKPKATDKPKVAAKSAAKAKKFEALKKADGAADDLKLISGVGPKLEEKLNQLGIWHFWQIAGFSEDDIERIDDELNFKGRITRDEWLTQAKTLMSGGTNKAKSPKKPAAKKD